MVCFTPCVMLSPLPLCHLQPIRLLTGPYFRCCEFCISFQLRSVCAGTATPANCFWLERLSWPPKHLMWPVLGFGRQMLQRGVYTTLHPFLMVLPVAPEIGGWWRKRLTVGFLWVGLLPLG